jgi:hypothetical protein
VKNTAVVHLQDFVEAQWREALGQLKGPSSELGRLLAIHEAREVFVRRSPRMQLSGRFCALCGGGSPKATPDRLKMRLFVLALEQEAGLSRATTYRYLGYAERLVARVGLKDLRKLLGTPVANDDRFLHKLSTLENFAKCWDVLDVYALGVVPAGRRAARDLLDAYLEEQAARKALADALLAAISAPVVHQLGPVSVGQATGAEEQEQEQAAPRFLHLSPGELVPSGRLVAIVDGAGNPVEGFSVIVEAAS